MGVYNRLQQCTARGLNMYTGSGASDTQVETLSDVTKTSRRSVARHFQLTDVIGVPSHSAEPEEVSFEWKRPLAEEWATYSWAGSRAGIDVAKLFIFITFFISFIEGAKYVPFFKNFPVATLQHHIQISRHLPLCVVYRKEDFGSKLEHKLKDLWSARNKNVSYSSWEVGAFNINQHQHKVPLSLPSQVPQFWCYIGHSRPHVYTGKLAASALHKWLHKLALTHSQQLEEATVDVVETTVRRHKLTLIGFSGLQDHHQLEDLLAEVQGRWRSEVKVLLVHPHSPDVRSLSAKYSVHQHPAVVMLSPAVGKKMKILKKLERVEVTQDKINLFIASRSFPVLKLTAENFEQEVMIRTKYYIPILVLFYASWAPDSLPCMNGFRTFAEDMRALNVNLRFGLVELTEQQFLVNKWLDPSKLRSYPFTILFKTKVVKTTVVGIEQFHFFERSSPFALSGFLQNPDLNILRTKSGKTVLYQPWGKWDPLQVSSVHEGPFGSLCTVSAHNQTDNTPVVLPKIKRSKPKTVQKNKKKKTFHDLFGSEEIDQKLRKVGTLPVVTDTTWQEVVEKSHAPSHPFIKGSRWQGEVTKVTMVVFIIEGCGSCRNNMDTFEKLHKSVKYIEGGSLYLMNCTSDPLTCRENGVTGYPTISAFRGLGWLGSDHCVTSKARAEKRVVKVYYHGVLLVKPIMEWFAAAAQAAVSNARFEQLDNDEMEENVHLVATVIPRGSRFLPFVSRQKQYYYPYECFRLSCERLYGQASCFAVYSQEIPRQEYDDEEQDMIVSQVQMYRQDGLAATVVQLGKPLMRTLEEESDVSLHRFHRPHKYQLNPKQKCEDNHAACTDLVVSFTQDHGRLPITHLSSALFHTKNSIIFSDELPVLIALVYQDNVTQEAKFSKTLLGVAHELYSDVVVVTLDVDQYPAWAGQFVPAQYDQPLDDAKQLYLYTYPRFCMVQWGDHKRAAFYPDMKPPEPDQQPFRFMKKHIIKFAKEFLNDPESMLVETEFF